MVNLLLNRLVYGEAREDEGIEGEISGVQLLNRRNSRTNILTESCGYPALPASTLTMGDPSVEDVLQLLRQLYILAHEDKGIFPVFVICILMNYISCG